MHTHAALIGVSLFTADNMTGAVPDDPPFGGKKCRFGDAQNPLGLLRTDCGAGASNDADDKLGQKFRGYLRNCSSSAVIIERLRGRDPELAQLVQNPIAKVISLPFQNNLNFGVGPRSDEQDVFNIQPVLPFDVGSDWNLIARAIIPVVHEPALGPGTESMNGLGDASLALYLSPAHPDGIIWGVGPAFTFATASRHELGQGKYDAGLSAVALTIRGPWLLGALVTDVASVAGASDRTNVHQMLLQPFVNYNFTRGWYLASSPIITANWEVPGSQRWTVPVGGGGGRAFRVGKQAMNFQMQVFRNAVRPQDAGDWTLRAQFQLLFPK